MGGSWYLLFLVQKRNAFKILTSLYDMVVRVDGYGVGRRGWLREMVVVTVDSGGWQRSTVVTVDIGE